MGGDLVCRLGQFGRNRSIVSAWGGRTLPLISFRMAGRVGRIDVFDDSVESWCSYTERLDQYFLREKGACVVEFDWEPHIRTSPESNSAGPASHV